MAKILLHELIHICRPLWSETRTLKEEGRLWKVSTWKEKAELFKMLGRAHIWSGEGSVPEEVGAHIGGE